MGKNNKKVRRSKEIKPSKETQMLAKYIAIVVRNAMEDFHRIQFHYIFNDSRNEQNGDFS